MSGLAVAGTGAGAVKGGGTTDVATCGVCAEVDGDGCTGAIMTGVGKGAVSAVAGAVNDGGETRAGAAIFGADGTMVGKEEDGGSCNGCTGATIGGATGTIGLGGVATCGAFTGAMDADGAEMVGVGASFAGTGIVGGALADCGGTDKPVVGGTGSGNAEVGAAGIGGAMVCGAMVGDARVGTGSAAVEGAGKGGAMVGGIGNGSAVVGVGVARGNALEG